MSENQANNPPQPPKRPAGARPAGARPAGARPAGARPAGARPEGAHHANQEMSFTFNKFVPAYIVTWENDNDTCSICRKLFLEPCVHCDVAGITDACAVQEGICGHTFHLHCIERWLQQNKMCPLCSELWSPK